MEGLGQPLRGHHSLQLLGQTQQCPQSRRGIYLMSEVYYREDVYAFIETDEFAFLFALHFVDANFNTA